MDSVADVKGSVVSARVQDFLQVKNEVYYRDTYYLMCYLWNQFSNFIDCISPFLSLWTREGH